MTFGYMPYWKKLDAKVEGASQRIQEDCMNFAKIVESIGLQIIRAIMLLIAFIPILWGLSSNVILPLLKDVSGSLVYISLFGPFLGWCLGVFWQRCLQKMAGFRAKAGARALEDTGTALELSRSPPLNRDIDSS